jgi:hypothetical protein
MQTIMLRRKILLLIGIAIALAIGLSTHLFGMTAQSF